MDKLTGKLPADLKSGLAQQLPPIITDSEKKKKGPKSKISHMSATTKSKFDDNDGKQTDRKKELTGDTKT